LFGIGSFIGGIIGFFIGIVFFHSLILAFIFMFIGNALSSGFGRRKSGPGFFGWSNSGANSALFNENLFSMLGRLAAADGKVTENEINIFRSVVINNLGVTDPVRVEKALETFKEAAYGDIPMGEYARRTAAVFSHQRQILEIMLILMIQVTAAKGVINSEEDKLLRETASIFNFPPSYYENLKNRTANFSSGRAGSGENYSGSSSDTGSLKYAYEVLGVSPESDVSEIRKAYRKKASEYHPDKIASKGLPEEFTELANKKFQEIQNAWETIRKARDL